MDVSIIIVNYNTKELLFNCLTSIYSLTQDVVFEVIVVDNASKDASQEMVKQQFPQVVFIQSEVNLGFGRANNKGAEIAKGKYLFFLNSDTELKNNAINLFFRFINEHSDLNIGALGSELINQNEAKVQSFEVFPNLRRDVINELKVKLINIFGRNSYINLKSALKITYDSNKNKERYSVNEFYPVDYITGADLFMPKNVFVEMNGFDELFFMYYEETDLQYRMNKNKYNRFIITTPKIYHLEKGSWGKKSLNQQLMQNQSSFIFYEKNFSFKISFLYRLLFILIQPLIILDRSFTFKEKWSYLNKICKKTHHIR